MVFQTDTNVQKPPSPSKNDSEFDYSFTYYEDSDADPDYQPEGKKSRQKYFSTKSQEKKTVNILRNNVNILRNNGNNQYSTDVNNKVI